MIELTLLHDVCIDVGQANWSWWTGECASRNTPPSADQTP